jgi:hypothetical protein
MAATATAFSGELPHIRHGGEGLMDTMIVVHGGEGMVENNQYALSLGLVGLKKHGRTSGGKSRGNMPANRRMKRIAMAISAIATCKSTLQSCIPVFDIVPDCHTEHGVFDD